MVCIYVIPTALRSRITWQSKKSWMGESLYWGWSVEEDLQPKYFIAEMGLQVEEGCKEEGAFLR